MNQNPIKKQIKEKVEIMPFVCSSFHRSRLKYGIWSPSFRAFKSHKQYSFDKMGWVNNRPPMFSVIGRVLLVQLSHSVSIDLSIYLHTPSPDTSQNSRSDIPLFATTNISIDPKALFDWHIEWCHDEAK